jgi:hypothetical protein
MMTSANSLPVKGGAGGLINLTVMIHTNADAAKQITAGTSRDDGLGLTWIGNTQLVYGYLGGSNVRVARLELPEGQPSDLRLPGEAEFAPASCNGAVVYVQVGKQSFFRSGGRS